MPIVRRLSLWGSVLVFSLAGCDRDEPLAPSFASGGRTLTAPSSATAIAISSSQLDVTWQDNSDNEDGFEVYVAASAAGPFSLWSTTGPNATTQSFSGIAAEREYCVQVRALTARGKSRTYSAFSNIACASTALPPSAPLRTDVTPLSSSGVSIAWVDNSNNEAGFRVERSVDAGVTWTLVATTSPGVTYLQDGGLATEREVCYRVIAFNGRGDSAPTADCTTPPAAPSDVTATGVATPAIDLAWTDNSAAEDWYEVLRSLDDFSSFAVIATLPPNTVNYHDAAVAGNTRYEYAVRARKDNGYSSRSNTASAIAATTLPNPPSGTDAYPWGSSAVQVIWADNSGNEAGFRVERSRDGGASWSVAGTTGASPYAQGWFLDAESGSDQQVCYRVVAFNGLGESAPSNTDCATPVAAPTNLVATTAPGLAIDLTWTDNSSVEDGYEVRRLWCDYSYWEPYCDYFTLAILGPNATSYHDAQLAGESHSYVVVALEGGFPSDLSNEASAFTEFPPAAPSNLTAAAASPGQIDLAWTVTASNAQEFTIERCMGDGITCGDAGFVQIAWGWADVTTFNDVTVQAGTTYTYRVRVYGGGQVSEPSNEATATAS